MYPRYPRCKTKLDGPRRTGSGVFLAVCSIDLPRYDRVAKAVGRGRLCWLFAGVRQVWLCTLGVLRPHDIKMGLSRLDHTGNLLRSYGNSRAQMEVGDVQGRCSVGFLARRPIAQHTFIGGKAIGRTSSVQRQSCVAPRPPLTSHLRLFLTWASGCVLNTSSFWSQPRRATSMPKRPKAISSVAWASGVITSFTPRTLARLQ